MPERKLRVHARTMLQPWGVDMKGELIQALSLATAGITVATTGAIVLVLQLLFSGSLDREIEEDLRRR
jgi:hypothetical protein